MWGSGLNAVMVTLMVQFTRACGHTRVNNMANTHTITTHALTSTVYFRPATCGGATGTDAHTVIRGRKPQFPLTQPTGDDQAMDAIAAITARARPPTRTRTRTHTAVGTHGLCLEGQEDDVLHGVAQEGAHRGLHGIAAEQSLRFGVHVLGLTKGALQWCGCGRLQLRALDGQGLTRVGQGTERGEHNLVRAVDRRLRGRVCVWGKGKAVSAHAGTEPRSRTGKGRARAKATKISTKGQSRRAPPAPGSSRPRPAHPQLKHSVQT